VVGGPAGSVVAPVGSVVVGSVDGAVVVGSVVVGSVEATVVVGSVVVGSVVVGAVVVGSVVVGSVFSVTVQLPEPVATPVRPFSQVAVTVSDVPEKLTVVDPPAGIDPEWP